MTTERAATTPQRAEPSPTISFDLDGTLVHGPYGAALRDILPSLGAGEDAHAAVSERHHALLRERPYDAYDWLGIIESVTGADQDETWRRLLPAAYARGVRLVHDATTDLLTAFRARGWRVVVLTNGRRRYQEPVVAMAGLPIDELIGSDDAGEAKPGRAMFDAARGTSSRHVHVGDRLDHDVAGAAGADATAVLLRPDAPFSGRTAELDDAASDRLRGYLATVAGEEGSETYPWPDVIASSLRELSELLHEGAFADHDAVTPNA